MRDSLMKIDAKKSCKANKVSGSKPPRIEKLIKKKKSSRNNNNNINNNNNNNNNNNQRPRFSKSVPFLQYLRSYIRYINHHENCTMPTKPLDKNWFMQPHDNDTNTTTYCSKCGFSFSPASKNRNSNTCLKCIPRKEDHTRRLPKSIDILHCQGCQSYSCTGYIRSPWIKVPQGSIALLMDFFLKRLHFYIATFQLTLSDAWFLPFESSNPESIKISLKFQFENVKVFSRREKICIVEYKLHPYYCPSCDHLIDETQLRAVVQLRKYASDKQTFSFLQFGTLRYLLRFKIKRVKQEDHGVDFFFCDETNAVSFYSSLRSLLPVKGATIHAKFSTDQNPATSQSCISALVCPICSGDLVYLNSRVSASLGVNMMGGGLVICTKISNKLNFLDPFNAQQFQMDADDYWKEPFEALKTKKNIVEYVVFDVKIVSKGRHFFVADVQVARASDVGKINCSFWVRSHLGKVLKAGDYALGYDLSSEDFTDGEIQNCNGMQPNVVLMTKRWNIVKQLNMVSGQKSGDKENVDELLADLVKQLNMVSGQKSGDKENVDELLADLAELDLS